ncbi:MAG: C-GCAxxG-C-C family protein [Pyramidobacter sp.]|nr:C-GCAxxG-C-C family protein [Pyramidobacter sp.]
MSECNGNCSSCASACNADPWLASLDERVRVISKEQKFCCSQTVLKIGMERLGMKDDEELMRAMAGFCGGFGCGGTCGALCGGAALMGLYLGKGTADEPRSEKLRQLTADLAKTFEAYWKSTVCDDLVHGDAELKKVTCPSIMAGTVEMVWGILYENGINLDVRPAASRK